MCIPHLVIRTTAYAMKVCTNESFADVAVGSATTKVQAKLSCKTKAVIWPLRTKADTRVDELKL